LDLLTPYQDEAGDLEEAAEQVMAVRRAADLPILARIPMSASDEAVQTLADLGAVDALVLAQPPDGLRYDAAAGAAVTGQFHGRALASLAAARIASLAVWTRLPLVACGGIHTLDDALACLAVGAAAIQIDTAVWVDPLLPERIVEALGG
jgi:dihydroorotate dehydrogenase (NAD+) catalytic subunit